MKSTTNIGQSSKAWVDDIINAFSGGMAGLMAAVVTCPLDMVKLRLQNKHSTTTTTQVFNEIWRESGLKGLYKGVGPTAAGYLPAWAIYFVVYDASKKWYRSLLPEQSPLVHNILASLQGGMCSTIATNPLWVARTRIMTQSSSSSYFYSSTKSALASIVRKEGWKALFKGLGPSLLGVSHVVIQFPVYELLKSSLIERNVIFHPELVSIGPILVASGLSKMMASSITYPHEVIRTRLHTQIAVPEPMAYTRYMNDPVDPPKKPVMKYKGIVQTARIILAEEGWKGFYRGFGINLFRTVPASSLTILTYELISSNTRAFFGL